MKLEKLVKLEKALGGRLDRLTRRRGSAEDPSEWIPAMLDEIEQKILSPDGVSRVFPYDAVRVELRVDPASLEGARVVFTPVAFESRVRDRLRQVRCEMPEDLRVKLHVRARESADESPYALAYRRTPAATAAKAPVSAAVPPVRVLVLEGQCRKRTHDLKLERINLGRLDSVEGRGPQQLRKNHIAFLDRDGDPINATVSRAHAHIEYFVGDGFRVFDDGSAQGTRVHRDGRSLPVARGAVRGVKLRPGDHIELGLARVAFVLGDAGAGEKS
jgi:hypothetical protein